jgi:4-hydroxy-tetrahydrodipicolinate reductase
LTQLRVVQWATGNIGRKSLRGVIEHPRLELVGVRVYGSEKVGVDAGMLCGLEPVGVPATDSLDAVLALDPDCVLYMPRACDMDDVCRLLASGANVVTTRGEFHHPASMPAADRDRVEAACAAGATSIHSTGSSPGFITEAVPIVLASIQRRLDVLTIEESADMSPRNSPEMIFDLMGFGRPPAAIDERRLNHGLHSFGPSLRQTASTLGIPLDDVKASGEVATARTDIEIAAGPLAAGTVAAQRTIVDGLRDGRPVVRFFATWYVTADLEPAWDVRPTGWRVSVEGDAPLDVELRFPFDLDRMAELSPGYSANRAVNAVPVVCAAESGIRTTADLPQIVADLSRSTGR